MQQLTIDTVAFCHIYSSLNVTDMLNNLKFSSAVLKFRKKNVLCLTLSTKKPNKNKINLFRCRLDANPDLN